MGSYASASDPREVLTIHAPNGAGAFGGSVVFVPDLTGDGLDEILVGEGQTSGVTGGAYLFNGSDGTLLLSLDSPGLNHGFGFDVAVVGDLNGDSFSEIAVGSRCTVWPSCPSPTGASIIDPVTGSQLYSFTGDGNSFFGDGVAGLGDVNQDGVGDFIIGSSDDNCAGTDTGRVFAYSGADGSLLYAVCGSGAWDRFGVAGISSVGDVDGDGNSDWVAGALEYGCPSPCDGPGYARLVSGSTGATIHTYTDSSGISLGVSPAPAGDLNGDKTTDYYVGDSTQSKLHAVSGATGSAIWIREIPGSNFGENNCRIEDLDGDGVSDVCSQGSTSNTTYVLSGATGETIFEIPNAAGTGDLDASGDVTGDGFPDLAIADRGAGVVRIFSFSPDADRWEDLGGGSSGTNGNPTLTVSGPLTVGSILHVELANAAPNAPMLAWLSIRSVPLSALGGTIYAYPVIFQTSRQSDESGAHVESSLWRPGVPSGAELYLQYLIQDFSVPDQITLSNAVTATTP